MISGAESNSGSGLIGSVCAIDYYGKCLYACPIFWHSIIEVIT
jgi:hypothetical protein